MEVKACDICLSIKGIRGVDLPYKLTSKPSGTSFKHVDLCPEHLARALHDAAFTYPPSAKHAVDVGRKVLDWVEKNKGSID